MDVGELGCVARSNNYPKPDLSSLVLDSAAAFTSELRKKAVRGFTDHNIVTHRLYTSRAGNKGSDSVVKDVIAVTWEAAILPAGCMFIAVVLYNQPVISFLFCGCL